MTTTMKELLLVGRYTAFGALIVCNAIIASVAAWNLGMVQTDGQEQQIDIYLIFLGAFALLIVFPIIFSEIVFRRTVTSHVWFECVWISILWIMELAGAAAVTAILPDAKCNTSVIPSLHTNGACTSTRVLLAFTWICTGILLFYLLLLVIGGITHHKRDPEVWLCPVRTYEWCSENPNCRLRSSPPSPSGPLFDREAMVVQKTVPPISAPQPRRPIDTSVYNTHRSRLHDVEPVSGSSIASNPVVSERPVPPIPVAARTEHTAQDMQMKRASEPSHKLAYSALPQWSSANARPSLYGQHIQAALQSNPRALPPVHPKHASAPSASTPLQTSQRSSADRRDLPARKLPPPTFTFPGTQSSTVEPPITTASSRSSSERPRHPSGPRSFGGSGDGHRPPPLDLSGISSFREVERKVARRN